MKNLSWEVTSQFDLGLEAGFLKNKLNIEIDYYEKTTDDLLLNATLARQTGFTSQLTNIGSIENKGVDITVSAKAIVTTENFQLGKLRQLHCRKEQERGFGTCPIKTPYLMELVLH